MRPGLGVFPLTSLGAVLVALSTLIAPTAYAQSHDIWDAAASGQLHHSGSLNSSLVDQRIGQYFHFKNVGNVFYAGISGGEVYYADLDEPGVMDWEEAVQACGRKGTGWSLPTAEQLELLYKHTHEIDLYEKDIRNTQAFWYWSSSTVDSEFALRVRPYDGLNQPVKRKFSARVRCVRVY